MSDLREIETLSAAYAEAMAELSTDVQILDSALRTVKRKSLPGIKRAAERAAAAKSELKVALERSRDLFASPRTKVLHGIKVGFAKSKGKVEMSDEAAVIARIRRLLPAEQAELLIRVEESVHKPAVYDLAAADLKRLGIEITGTGDQPVIKLVDSDVEKIVDALLKGDDEASDGE